MFFSEVVAALEGETVQEGAGYRERVIRHVMASDLMSDVLVMDREHMLLLTSLASDQVVRTADIVGACGIVVVNGKTLPKTMTALARETGLTLIRSPLPKFEACLRLGRLLESPPNAP